MFPHLGQVLNDFAHQHLSGTSEAPRQAPLEPDPCNQPAVDSKQSLFDKKF